jgi:predicted AAA+ superfamily ATPase
VSLEDPDVRAFAQADPRGFLAQFPSGAVFDEAPRVPDLFSYIQTRVDADPAPGGYVLTGSQQLGIHAGVSQSLAGRAGLLTLYPFTLGELGAAGRPASLEATLAAGLFPPVHDRGIPPHLWYAAYVATYVERDVRALTNVRDLATFQRFVHLCGARTGQLLNLSAMAADAGVTHNTALAWIGVLEASHLVIRLQPYHANLGKRLTKAPKLYMLDCGLAAWLAGVRDADQLRSGAMRGPLFETLVVTEFLKHRANRLGPRVTRWT